MSQANTIAPTSAAPNTQTSQAPHTEHLRIALDGKSLEVAHHSLPAATGTILLLHEALGSVSYWKTFPQQLAHATNCNVIAYSRAGHGNSEGPLAQRTNDYYLHQVNHVIPSLLAHFSVTAPVLYGHSEGAGIAMLYAATRRIRALILESPFVLNNPEAVKLTETMIAAYPGSKLQQRLALYHQRPNDVFASWSGWATLLGKEAFPLRDFLPRIACPVLVLQGARDPFGTTLHLDALHSSIPHLQHETFAGTGHLPHREQTDRVLAAVSHFLSNLPPLPGDSSIP